MLNWPIGQRTHSDVLPFTLLYRPSRQTLQSSVRTKPNSDEIEKRPASHSLQPEEDVKPNSSVYLPAPQFVQEAPKAIDDG